MEKHFLNYLMKYAKSTEHGCAQFPFDYRKMFQLFLLSNYFFAHLFYENILWWRKLKMLYRSCLHTISFVVLMEMSCEMYMCAFGNLQFFMPRTSAENHCKKILLHCFWKIFESTILSCDIVLGVRFIKRS